MSSYWVAFGRSGTMSFFNLTRAGSVVAASSAAGLPWAVVGAGAAVTLEERRRRQEEKTRLEVRRAQAREEEEEPTRAVDPQVEAWTGLALLGGLLGGIVGAPVLGAIGLWTAGVAIAGARERRVR